MRTLSRCGKLEELSRELERYRWDVIGFTEIRWIRTGEEITDHGHKLFYSGHDKLKRHGVSFTGLIRKELINSILNINMISSRIISIQFAATPMNITIIKVYAPTTDYSDEDIDEFYELIEDTISKKPKKDFLVILGDLNVKARIDAHIIWPNSIGRFGHGSTNSRGERLLEFAEKHKFVLANTLYNHKNSRRTTWHAPNGSTDNQIDYILTPQRFKSSIITTSTRPYPGADIGSDHDLVLCNLKLKLCIRKRAIMNRIRFDLDKLENATTVNDYKVKLDIELSQVKINENDITETCNMVEKAILLTAEKTIRKYRKKKQPWITHNILDLCDDRRKLKALTKVKPVKPELKDKYRQINIRIRNLMKEAKETWIQSICRVTSTSINEEMAKGRANKKAYQTLKILTKTTIRKTMIILDKDNKPVTENIELIKTWTEYCKDLYNFKIKPDNNLLKPNIMNNNEESLPILESEVCNASLTLKNGKSPGPYNIPGELLKHGGESLIKIFTTICQQI